MAGLTFQTFDDGAKDLKHIEDLATSPSPTATDRKGQTKKTWAGIEQDLGADYAQTVTGANRLASEVAAGQATDAATVSLSTVNIKASKAQALADLPDEGVATILAAGVDGLTRTTTYVKRGGQLVPVLDPLSGSEFDGLIGQRPGGGITNFVAQDGTTSVAGVTKDSFQAAAFDVGGKLYGTRLLHSSEPLIVTGADGSSAVRFGRRGVEATYAALSEVETKVLRARRFAPRVAQAFPAEICHIIMYGQSLSMGERSLVGASAAISTTQPFDSLMFSSGTRPDVYGDASPYASLVPLVESVRVGIDVAAAGISNPGETPLSGCCDQIKRELLADGVAPGDYPFQLLGSCAGRGGTPLTGLVKGTAPYARLIAQVTAARNLATTQGKTYVLLAVPFLQGENGPFDRTEYKNMLLQLFADIDADVKAITGQVQEVLFPMYQTAGVYNFGAAGAQADVAEELPNAFVATPVYPLQTVLAPWNDGVHLSAESSRLMGAHIGRAIKAHAIDSRVYTGLRASAIRRAGRIITIDLDVPGSKAVIETCDTATGNPRRGFAGFELAVDGTLIESVYMASAKRIVIRCTADVPVGARLLYGRLGGNVRDDSGDVETVLIDGIAVPLDNYLQCFDITFTT
ncbi:hypothetical protein [Pseudacidovorax sp. RU35E]|uniref:hypothetical protein n=1 Tax=Pseudacidovorax sp. RU35E TaxID=1907403 RepID=UPI000955B978|nr:hypothetical protein [Pseudacidovorax sp. RU35E]SIQ99592.1 hypothetical protein SAMN05880557_10770 [Pseudacidovorax sp. RU35E]